MADKGSFTVYVNRGQVEKLNGVTLSDVCDRALLEWNDPDNADLQHSIRMQTIEDKLGILQKELHYLDSRRPLVVRAIQRYEEMLKREDERYEYARKTVVYNTYMRKLSEMAFALDFDASELRKQCAGTIKSIMDVNPMFNLEKWAENLKRVTD